MQRPLVTMAKLYSLFLILLVSGAPIVNSQAVSPKYGGTLVISHLSDASTLNPLLSIDDDSFMVANQMFNSLVTFDNDMNVVGDLAEKWEISKDGLTYTFYLYKNAKWHDGKPVTSADVKFTTEQYLTQSLPQSAFFAPIKKVEAPDQYTVVFRLEKPSAILMPLALAFWRGNKIIPKHLYEGQDIFKSEYNMKPVGSGPFVFQEWARGDRVVLVKNKDYFKKGLPYVDKIIFKVAPSSATQLAALESGEVNWVTIAPEVEAKRLNSTKGIKVAPVFTVLGLVLYIGVNLKHPVLGNVKVRQGLLQAINRQEIIDLALGGWGRPQKSWISSELKLYYNPNAPQYPLDTKKAEQLLDEAGFPRKADGTRFSLKIFATAGNLPQVRASEVLREQWKKVGVDLTVAAQDWPTIKVLITEKYDFDLVWFGHATGHDPDRLYVYYHSSQIFPGSWNYIRYSNPEVDKLWDESRTIVDPKERAKYFQKMQEIMMQEVPVFPVQERLLFAAFRDDWNTIPPGPFYYSNLMEKVWWSKGSELSPEAAASTLTETENKLKDLEKQGYDVKEALTKLAEAKKAFETGDYAGATKLAQAAITLAKAPMPIGLYSAVVIVVLAVAGASIYYLKKKRKAEG